MTTFSANTHTLQEPRYLNWSLGLEQKLPDSIYLKAEFLQRNGSHGLVYNTANGLPAETSSWRIRATTAITPSR